MQHAITEWASLAALVKLRYQVTHHNIPYWGPGSFVWLQLQTSVDGELCDVPMGTLYILPVLPIQVLYLAIMLCQLTHLNCMYCPWIEFPGSNNLAYEFHLVSAGESLPPSKAKLSSSSSVVKLQSSHQSLSPSSSVAKSQSGCWQSKSSNSSNICSPHLRFEVGSVWEGESSNSSNPHSPHLDFEDGSIRRSKSSKSGDPSSSSLVYYLDTNDGQAEKSQSSTAAAQAAKDR
jgi:hypothetical protein